MQKEQIICIDGGMYEGGGQMIRTAIALSILTGKSFKMHSIRKNRPNSGINNQIRNLLTPFCSSDSTPEIGKSFFDFEPDPSASLKPIKEIKSNTASSCTLMLQCIAPILVGFNHSHSVKVEGGTDVSHAPSLESVLQGLCPLLREANIQLDISNIKKGYYPVGKGQIEIRASDVVIKNGSPSPNKHAVRVFPINLLQMGQPSSIHITYFIRIDKNGKVIKEVEQEEFLQKSSAQFTGKIVKKLQETFKLSDEGLKSGKSEHINVSVKFQKVAKAKTMYGIGCVITGHKFLWDIGTVGQQVTEEEILARLDRYCQQRPVLDEKYQNQLLIYLCMSHGVSNLKVGSKLTMHTQSLIYTIGLFLPKVEFKHNIQTGVLSVKGVDIVKERTDFFGN